MSRIAERSRQAGLENERRVLGVLAAAGDVGLEPGVTVARAAMPAQTYRGVIARLESRGLVRREGKRRVFATQAGIIEAGAGVPGVDLVTPLRLSDGAAVLVDRGWAPSPDAYHVDQKAYREGDSADVLGIGVRAPRAPGDVNPALLRDSLPYPLLPFVMQQLPPATAPDRPLPPGLIRWPAPELSDGPHLSYAVQWFSFAVIIVVGSLALLRTRAQGPPRGTQNGRS